MAESEKLPGTAWSLFFPIIRQELGPQLAKIEDELQMWDWKDGEPPRDEIMQWVAWHRFKKPGRENPITPKRLKAWANKVRRQSGELRELWGHPVTSLVREHLDEVYSELRGGESDLIFNTNVPETLTVMERFANIVDEASDELAERLPPDIERKRVKALDRETAKALADLFVDKFSPKPDDRPAEEAAAFVELISECFGIDMPSSTRSLRR